MHQTFLRTRLRNSHIVTPQTLICPSLVICLRRGILPTPFQNPPFHAGGALGFFWLGNGRHILKLKWREIQKNESYHLFLGVMQLVKNGKKFLLSFHFPIIHFKTTPLQPHPPLFPLPPTQQPQATISLKYHHLAT